MAIIISSLRAAMDMALNFCCPCLTTRDDPSPPTPPQGSGISSSEKGGPSKGDGSSVQGVSDVTGKIMRTAGVAMDEIEGADADLDGLIDYMSELLEILREKSPLKKLAEKKLQRKKSPAPTSTGLLSFKAGLTGATEAASAMEEILSANAVAVDVLKAIGQAGSLATAGLLVCATVLESFENVSKIEEECLDLIEEMYRLAKHVRELQGVPQLKEELKDPLKKATELILEASVLCCFQIDSSKFARFFSTSDNKENLLRVRKELKAMYRDLDNGKFMCLYNRVSDNAISQKRRKAVPIEYPQDTVGMDEPLKRVIKLLDWESEKNALAVVVHGFGGLGKTTLADAVYATLFDTIEGCQYCMVKLFDTIESTPNVIDLQTQLIKDLRTGTTEEAEAMPEIKTFEEGQREISRLLDQQVAFIYIDNVLHRDALEQLLPPQGMRKARKLRLLLTARDATATDSIISVKREFYPIETLPDTEAEKLIKKVLDDNEKQLNPSQMEQIVRNCGGVPKLLTVVAGFICSEGNAQDAFRTVKEAWENNWKGKIGGDIERYVFACNKLEKDLKEAFLDICYFFQGWDWEELTNIVGKTALDSLQKRALVTQDVKNRTATVHDVILTVGLRETEGKRFRFSRASQFQQLLDQENNKALKKIKGIWSSSDHSLSISARKLDLMAASIRVLNLGRLTVVQGEFQMNFKELVFFSAGISHLPFDVSKSKKLRHLCYSPEDLKDLSQMPSDLRHIDFQLKSPSFQITSQCIKQLSKLRVLRLKNAEFKRLPQNLGDLGDGLQELTLLTCKFLEELPESITTLGSLRVLRMDSCSGLTQLPEGFGNLTSLQELHLAWCENLKELPTSFGKLTSLQKLHLSQCKSLKALPTSLGKLTSLQELHLADCKSLEALPGSLEELSSLRLLDLAWATRIEHLPDGLGKLTSLVNLLLYYCKRLDSIPESIGRLTSLDSINLSGSNLKELPDRFCHLSSITRLAMDGCRSLERLPDRFGAVTSLSRLAMCRCESLKKLPESFSQLKYLEYLNLSWCWNLEELCEHFKGLSSLRVLLLAGCKNLGKLPEDFHCLQSLETLDLENCAMLEGKSMEGIVKLKKLQTVLISGSPSLLEKWGEIQKQCDRSWSFAVVTGEGSLQGKGHFNLTNGQGKAFNISDFPLPLNTELLVLFDCQQEFGHCSTLTLIEEIMDDNLEMIYFGNHFSKLPHKVAGGIRGHAPAKLFGQLFPSLAYQREENFYVSLSAIRAEIVPGEKGEKTLSCGEILNGEWYVEKFVVEKCGRYLKFKQLAETPGDSNIELLRELFANGEEKSSYGFLKNGASAKVGVEEMKGKRILLDMRPANLCYDIPLQSLVDLYKERFDFEIITIPMMQPNTRRDVSNSFSREVPWLVLQNPWDLPNATKYFLLQCSQRYQWVGLWESLEWSWDKWYPSEMRIIESNGTIAAYNSLGILCMVNMWGTEAFPFTEEKRRELIDKEVKQMKEMSNLMFLFQHLQGISEQVEKAMRQQKMFWLCIGDCTTFMKSMLVEWNDNIYTIYIPKFYAPPEGGQMETVYFTHRRSEAYMPLQHPTAVTQVEMEGMCSLSLSEHQAIRFWARFGTIIKDSRFSDMRNFLEFSQPLHTTSRFEPWMIIMDEDGNLITKQGNFFIKLLSEEHSHDKAKGLVQQLINGDKESRKETLIELEQLMKG